MNTIGYSSPLALCRVISVTRPSSSLRVSASATSATCCRKHVERRPRRRARGGVELAADLDELLEVLDAPLGLDRALGLERLDVAGLREQRLEQLGDRRAAAAASSRSSPIVPMKRASALTAAGAEAGNLLGLGRRPPRPACRASAAWAITRASEVCADARAAGSWRRA